MIKLNESNGLGWDQTCKPWICSQAFNQMHYTAWCVCMFMVEKKRTFGFRLTLPIFNSFVKISKIPFFLAPKYMFGFRNNKKINFKLCTLI